MTCSVEDCVRPSARGGLCWAHVKRRQEERPISPPVRDSTRSPSEVVTDAALRYADATEEDVDFENARANLLMAAENFGRRRTRERIRAALAQLKSQGRHVGRPFKVPRDAILAAVERLKSAVMVARELGISERTVRRVTRSKG